MLSAISITWIACTLNAPWWVIALPWCGVVIKAITGIVKVTVD